MSKALEECPDFSCRCPVCDVKLAAEPALPAYDTPCPDCGCSLWCRKRLADAVVILSVLPGRIPEHSDIERLAESLVRSRGIPRVVVDLSGLEIIRSAVVARLIALRKRVVAAKGRLILCGLSPMVREIFRDTRMDKVFDILDTEANALSTLNAEPGLTTKKRPMPGRTTDFEAGEDRSGEESTPSVVPSLRERSYEPYQKGARKPR